MKKTAKRVLSMLLAVLMMTCLIIPQTAFADEEGFSISLTNGLNRGTGRAALTVVIPDGMNAGDFQVTLYQIVNGTPEYLDWGFLDLILERGGFGYYLGFDCGSVYRFCITDKGGKNPSTIYASTADTVAKHDLTETPQQDATCAKTGIKAYYECSACHKLFSDSDGTQEITDLDAWMAGDGKIGTLPHAYGEWEKDSETQHKRICADDASHVEYADHAWDDGKVAKEATTEAEGEMLFTCTACGETKTEIIEKLAPVEPEKPEEPKGDGPTTGDDLKVWLYVDIMLACALVIAAVLIAKKKQNCEAV